jgi:hypothetical protein
MGQVSGVGTCSGSPSADAEEANTMRLTRAARIASSSSNVARVFCRRSTRGEAKLPRTSAFAAM